MGCGHERIRCTDNVFYCLDCGARIEPPKREEKSAEEKKTPVKRRAKKESE